MNAFVLLLPEPDRDLADPEVIWGRVGSGGQVADRGHEPLAQAANRIRRGERVVAVVPGERVLLHHVTIPARSRAAQLQALPYALEDRLSEDLDALHIVPGPRRPDGQLLAAVAAHRDMDAWRAWLGAAGIVAERLLPDTALVPAEAGHLHLYCDARRCLLAPPDAAEPVALAPELLPWWLERWQADADASVEMDVHAPRDHGPDTLTDASNATFHDWDGDWLQLLAPALARRPALNLLTGRHAGSAGMGAALAQWRLPAAIAAALVLLWTGSLWLEVRQLEREVGQLDRAITGIFETTLPEERMVDPVRQFQQILAAGDTGSGAAAGPVATRLARVAPVLVGDGIELRQIRAENDRLELELDLASIAALDGLRGRLADTGAGTVRILGAESGEAGVRTRLQIEGGGS
jgi:general secretion pathway protein L